MEERFKDERELDLCIFFIEVQMEELVRRVLV